MTELTKQPFVSLRNDDVLMVVRETSGGTDFFQIRAVDLMTSMNIGSYAEISGANETISPMGSQFSMFDLTPDQPSVVTLGAAVTGGLPQQIILKITQPATGGFPVDIAGNITWPNGEKPVISAAAGDVTVITFLTADGGKTYVGGL